MTDTFFRPCTTIIDTATLSGRLRDIRVLDCRARLGDPGFNARAHAEGHIPGAVRADLDTDLAGAPGKSGRHPLPDAEALVARCRYWGIDDTTQVVVYDDMGGMFAARAWWLLRWLGHDAVAVLDGGWQAWLKHGGSVENHTPGFAPGKFTRRQALTKVLTAADVLSRITSSAHAGTLIDARAEARFRGEQEPVDHTAGHIPGAICRPATGNLDAQQCFVSPAELAERFSGLNGEIICYCGSGVTAAHNVLAMRIAGLPEPALYPGSWSEWIEDPARPIAKGQ